MFVSAEHFQGLKQSVKVKNEWENPINYDPLLKLPCSEWTPWEQNRLMLDLLHEQCLLWDE